MRACNCEQARELRKRIAELEEALKYVRDRLTSRDRDAVNDSLIRIGADL